MTDYLSNEKANKIRTGGYLLLKCFPCRVVDIHKSKTGKHGGSKMRFVGIDVFTGKKYEDWFPGTENVEVPEIIKYDLRVTEVDDKWLTGATNDGSEKTIALPTSTAMMELVDSIRDKFAEEQPIVVTVLACVGKEGIIRVRDAKHTAADSD
jgi:translation initiation factor 5A